MFAQWPIRTKLPILIVAAALIAIVATAVISDRAATKQIKISIDNQLEAHLAARVTALETFEQGVRRDVQLLLADPVLLQALRSFDAGWTDLRDEAPARLKALYVTNNPHPPGSRQQLQQANDRSLYSVAHERYHPRLQRHMEVNGYSDLLLIVPDGRVVYSVAKASDFAGNVREPPYDAEIAAAAASAVIAAPEDLIVFTDFQVTQRMGQAEEAAALAAPLLRPDGALLGVLVAIIDASDVDAIMDEGQGLAASGQTYLVGPDHLLRSSVRSEEAGSILKVSVHAPEIDRALAGEAGIVDSTRAMAGTSEPVEQMIAFTPIDFFGQRYAVIAETVAAEMFAPITSMREAGFVAAAGVFLFLVAVSMLLARTITQPLTRATGALRGLAAGELGPSPPETKRRDEIGDLVTTVAAFREEIIRRQAAEDAMRQAKEQADAASKAKSDFLAVMSHEIRTPMHGVIGLMELLRATDLAPNQRKLADEAQQSSEALLRILNEILDFSKIEAGELEPAVEDVAVPALVASVADAFHGVAERKGLTLTVDVAEDVPRRVRTDPLRLRQILWNLMGNAIKFTERGGVGLHVSAARRPEDDKAMLTLRVSDSGIGIPADAIPRLFEPFRQGDPSTTRRYGGTGLGLSISQRLARLLGGTITVDSETGKGSTFTVHVPVSRAAGPTAAAPAVEAERTATPPGAAGPDRAAAAPPPGGRDILVVEDHATNRFLIDAQLRQLGFSARLCADGEEAWESLLRRPASVVLTDYHMPRLNGIDLAKRIRNTPEFARMPIIGLTADALDGSKQALLDAGMDTVLVKPLHLTTLERVLAETRIAPSVAPDRVEAGPIEMGPIEVGPIEVGENGDRGDSPAAAADDAALPAFDETNVVEAFGGCDARVCAIVKDFLAKTRAQVGELQELVRAQDVAAVERTAHHLAGSALTIGAVRLGTVCRSVEQAAHARDGERVRQLTAGLDRCFGELEQAISAFTARQTAPHA